MTVQTHSFFKITSGMQSDQTHFSNKGIRGIMQEIYTD